MQPQSQKRTSEALHTFKKTSSAAKVCSAPSFVANTSVLICEYSLVHCSGEYLGTVKRVHSLNFSFLDVHLCQCDGSPPAVNMAELPENFWWCQPGILMKTSAVHRLNRNSASAVLYCRPDFVLQTSLSETQPCVLTYCGWSVRYSLVLDKQFSWKNKLFLCYHI